MAATEYVLQPRPPMRAFFIAAIACLAGAGLVALSVSQQWHIAITVVFSLLIVMGLALGAAGFVSMRRNQVRVDLDETGYAISGLSGFRSGKWRDVTKVTETTDGRHITIYHGNVARTHLLCPSGTDTEQFKELLRDIAKRLDHAYGYGKE